LADRVHEEPSFADLGGRETDVTVLFADLAATDVYELLDVVP
jgi:hypothetical protein